MSFEPRFTISHSIIADLTRIERARGFLEAATISDDWIRQMGKRALVLEAHHTTHIEGTHLTLEESERLLAGEPVPEADPDDIQELLNYRDAFEFVSTWLGSGGPLTEGLVREIHKRLVQGVRGGSAAPGEYRRIQNYVVNPRTGAVVYTPPPAYKVPILMPGLIDWRNQESKVHPVLVSGIAQFQLVQIHPFLDGNGRTSRLLSTLSCTRLGTTSSASSASANTTTGTGPPSTGPSKGSASKTWISRVGSSSSRQGWPPSSTRQKHVESGRSAGTSWSGSTRCPTGRQSHWGTSSSMGASRFTTTRDSAPERTVGRSSET